MFLDLQIHTHIYIYNYTYIYVHMCVCIIILVYHIITVLCKCCFAHHHHHHRRCAQNNCCSIPINRLSTLSIRFDSILIANCQAELFFYISNTRIMHCRCTHVCMHVPAQATRGKNRVLPHCAYAGTCYIYVYLYIFL